MFDTRTLSLQFFFLFTESVLISDHPCQGTNFKIQTAGAITNTCQANKRQVDSQLYTNYLETSEAVIYTHLFRVAGRIRREKKGKGNERRMERRKKEWTFRDIGQS